LPVNNRELQAYFTAGKGLYSRIALEPAERLNMMTTLKLNAADFPGSDQGWAKLLPPRNSKAALEGSRRVRWAVIGAGFTGLACARRLAELNPSHEILLLEARELAQNASGRNSGYAVAVSDFSGSFEPDQIANYQRINRLNQAGIEILKNLLQTHSIDCQWRQSGYYRAAADQHALRGMGEFFDYLDALDIEHEPLTATELASRLGTSHYRCGLKMANGALLQPAALVYGLADSLPANITLHENTPVLQIRTGKTITLHTPQGQIETDNLSIAANYEAPKLGLLRARLIGSTLSGSCTRILSDDEYATLGSEPSWGVLSLHTGGATVRLTPDRRISIRNTAEYNGDALLSKSQLSARCRVHRAAFEARFPNLADVPFETSWSCVEGLSRNATNFFGKQGDNLFYAGGYNGSGVSRGTAFGTALADWASGADTPLIADCLASPHGQWIPPRPLLDVGAWFKVRSRFRGVGNDR